MILGLSFFKVFLMMDNAIKQKSGSPVSITQVLRSLCGTLVKTLVRTRSMHVGLSGLLQHLSCFIRLLIYMFHKKNFICGSSIPELRSPKIIIFSYYQKCKSKNLLNAARWFVIISKIIGTIYQIFSIPQVQFYIKNFLQIFYLLEEGLRESLSLCMT